MDERFVSVPKQGGDKLIPDGPVNPGVLHTVATGGSGYLGLYRLETHATGGNGKSNISGLGSSSAARESVKVTKFQTSYYGAPVDAMLKALGASGGNSIQGFKGILR